VFIRKTKTVGMVRALAKTIRKTGKFDYRCHGGSAPFRTPVSVDAMPAGV
jgi:hypothetical protein